MTRDNIIRMAREAGMEQEGLMFYSPYDDEFDVHIDHLEAFTKLVVAAERESCLEACRMYVDLNEPPDGFQNGVECCIAVITHKDDPDVMARIKAKGQK